MKKKQLTYVLVTVITLVWGAIGYKLYLSFFSTPELVVQTQKANKPLQLQEAVADTFTLVADYRDPFLGNLSRRRNQTSSPVTKPKRQTRPTPPKPVKKIVWPAIQYGGLVRNKQNEKTLALVRVNEQNRLMKLGEKHGEIELQGIYADSILVSMNAETKMVAKGTP